MILALSPTHLVVAVFTMEPVHGELGKVKVSLDRSLALQAAAAATATTAATAAATAALQVAGAALAEAPVGAGIDALVGLDFGEVDLGDGLVQGVGWWWCSYTYSNCNAAIDAVAVAVAVAPAVALAVAVAVALATTLTLTHLDHCRWGDAQYRYILNRLHNVVPLMGWNQRVLHDQIAEYD